MLTLRVAVDFGTSSTCAAVCVDGGDPQVVVVDGSPVMSSAVFAASDGELFVGREAERQAAIDPARYEPHPKRRIDERELLLGHSVVEVLDVVAAVLRRAVTEARRLARNAEVELLVLTHPANWGAVRSRVLRQAGHHLANEVLLVPEPVAADELNDSGRTLSNGDSLAVLDLGGGTVDVSVVRRQSVPPRAGGEGGSVPGDRLGGFGVLATKGDPNFGGADIDQLLLGHIGSLVTREDPDAWRKLVEGRELPDRRRRRVLAEDVRGAKESLSRHTYTDVPMPPPFPDAHVTRADLERLIAGPLGRTVDMTANAIADAGMRPEELAGVFLVGGSSRIPMVARLVHERTGIVPTTLDQPETVVARGALRALARPRQADEQPTVHITHPGRNRQGANPASGANPAVPPMPPGRPPAGYPGSGAHPQQRRPAAAPGSGFSPPHPGPSAQAAGQGSARDAGRRRWIAIGVAAALVLAIVLLLVLLTGGEEQRPAGRAGPAAPAGAGKQIAQYDYEFTLPEGWKQTGGDAQKRRVLIKPEDAAGGVDAIAVQEFELEANTDTDRQAVVNKLRENVEPRGGTDFTPGKRFAGKDVVYYRGRENGATVDWYVLFSGHVQVSTGCQFTENGRQRVQRACENVVRSLSITR